MILNHSILKTTSLNSFPETGIKRCLALLPLYLILNLPLGAGNWFQSGPGAEQRSPVSIGALKGSGWTLYIEKTNEDTEKRTLYYDTRIHSSVILIRKSGRLIRREERDAGDELLSFVEYAYDPEGNPRAVYFNTQSDDFAATHIETQTPAQIDSPNIRYQSGSGGNWNISDLDASGRPTREVKYRDNSLSVEENWIRSSDGRLLQSIKKEGDSAITSLYDSQGRLIQEQTQRQGLLVLTRNYTWQGTNLIRVEEQGEGRLSVREIEWSGNRIVRESRMIDGIIELEINWTTPKDRTETFYRKGRPVIRVYWSDNRRIKEEFLLDGKVVRVQESGP